MKQAMRWVGAAGVLAAVAWVFWQPPVPTEEGAGTPGAGPGEEGRGGAAESVGRREESGSVAGRAAEPVSAPPAPLDPAEAAVEKMLAGKTPDDWEPVLMELIENGDGRTVAALAGALGRERGMHQRMLICRVLCGIGTEESLEVFRKYVDAPENARSREYLAGALMGLENEELSGEVLDWLLETVDYDITAACQEAIGRLATGETLERIVGEHSRTNYNEYKLELMRAALAESECPEAIELFKDVLERSPERAGEELQASVAQALARIGTPAALDALVAALEKSPRAPEEDFLVEAVAGMAEMQDMAYLQARFDAAEAPNVRYALGRALAEAVPILKQYVEPPPDADADWPEDADETAVPMAIRAGEGDWEPEPVAEGEDGAAEDDPFADVARDEYGYPVEETEEPDPEDPSTWGPRRVDGAGIHRGGTRPTPM